MQPERTAVVERVLQVLRQWGWEAGAQRLREQIATLESDVDRQAMQHFLGWLAAERGDYAEAATQFEHLVAVPELTGWAHLGLAFVAMRSKDLEEAYQRLELAESMAAGDASLAGGVKLLRGTTLLHRGDSAKALPLLEEAVNMLGPDCFSHGRALDALGLYYAARDNFHAAFEIFSRALAHKESVQDAAGLAVTHGQLGRLMLDWGQFEPAEAHFRRDLDICRRIGDSRGEAQMYNFLGMLALVRQDADKAIAFLDHGIRLAQKGGWGVLEGYLHKDRAACWALHAQSAPARQELAQAERLFQASDFAEGIAHANRIWGIVHRLDGEWQESERRLRSALQFFETAGEPAEFARTQLEMARTLLASGAPQPLVSDAFLEAVRSAERSRRPQLVQLADRELATVDPVVAARHTYRRVRGRRIDNSLAPCQAAALPLPRDQESLAQIHQSSLAGANGPTPRKRRQKEMLPAFDQSQKRN